MEPTDVHEEPGESLAEIIARIQVDLKYLKAMSEVMLRSHAKLGSKLYDVAYEDYYQKLNSEFSMEFKKFTRSYSKDKKKELGVKSTNDSC